MCQFFSFHVFSCPTAIVRNTSELVFLRYDLFSVGVTLCHLMNGEIAMLPSSLGAKSRCFSGIVASGSSVTDACVWLNHDASPSALLFSNHIHPPFTMIHPRIVECDDDVGCSQRWLKEVLDRDPKYWKTEPFVDSNGAVTQKRIDPVASGLFQPMVQRGDGSDGAASAELLDLVVHQLLRYEDAERCSATAAREHAWFSKVPTGKDEVAFSDASASSEVSASPEGRRPGLGSATVGATARPSAGQAGAESPASAAASRPLCMTCLTAPSDATFVHGDTAHTCCCFACANKVFRKNRQCPICRQRVDSVTRNLLQSSIDLEPDHVRLHDMGRAPHVLRAGYNIEWVPSKGCFVQLDYPPFQCPVIPPKPEPVPEPVPVPADDEIPPAPQTPQVIGILGFLPPRGSGGPGGSVADTGGRTAGDAGPGSSSPTVGSTTLTPTGVGPTTNDPKSTEPAANPAESTEGDDPRRPPQTPAPKNPPRLPLEVDLKHSEKSDSVTLTQVLGVTVGIVCAAAAVSLLIRFVVMRAMETDVSRGARDQDGSRRRKEVRFRDEPSRQDDHDIAV